MGLLIPRSFWPPVLIGCGRQAWGFMICNIVIKLESLGIIKASGTAHCRKEVGLLAVVRP